MANDPINVTTGDDIVDAGDGVTSLREAIALAGATAGADTITFDPSVAQLTLNGALTVTFADGLVIEGGGLAIDAGGNSNHLLVAEGAQVTLKNLTLTGGYASGARGAPGGTGDSAAASIENRGDLTLDTVFFAQNTAEAGPAGPGGEPGEPGSTSPQSPGGPGGAGAAGGDGGDAAVVLNDASGTLHVVSAAFLGSDTVLGGSGGSGALGGRGGDGASYYEPMFDAQVGMPGGNGGAGGDGGDGGDAALIYSHGTMVLDDGALLDPSGSLQAGAAGQGGGGGAGGTGANGSSFGGEFTYHAADGQPGGRGANGAAGSAAAVLFDGVAAAYASADPSADLRASYGDAAAALAGLSSLADDSRFDILDASAFAATRTVSLSGDRLTVSTSGDTGLTLSVDGRTLTLTGEGAIDVAGGDQANFVTGNGGANHIVSGAGSDTLSGGDGADVLDGAGGDDRLFGGQGADTIYGGDGSNAMSGGAGDDVFHWTSESGRIYEKTGEGHDTVYASVSVSVVGQAIEDIFLVDEQNIDATGDKLANLIVGNDGANAINGSTGNDTISGGLGADSLTGGRGSDLFVFDTPLDGGIDHLVDVSHVRDRIQLDHTVFDALDLGSLSKAQFRDVSGGKAEDADDRILYDKNSGALFYDHDGAGGDAAVQFATIDTHASLDRGDFLVV